MRVTFWGAAREVTGSMHLIETGRARFAGLRLETGTSRRSE